MITSLAPCDTHRSWQQDFLKGSTEPPTEPAVKDLLFPNTLPLKFTFQSPRHSSLFQLDPQRAICLHPAPSSTFNLSHPLPPSPPPLHPHFSSSPSGSFNLSILLRPADWTRQAVSVWPLCSPKDLTCSVPLMSSLLTLSTFKYLRPAALPHVLSSVSFSEHTTCQCSHSCFFLFLHLSIRSCWCSCHTSASSNLPAHTSHSFLHLYFMYTHFYVWILTSCSVCPLTSAPHSPSNAPLSAFFFFFLNPCIRCYNP